MKAVIVSCFGYYDIRLKYVEQAFKKNGFEVKIFGSDYDHISKGYITKANENINMLHVPAYKKNISINRIFSHYIFAKSVYKELNKEKPDYVYALVPPNLLCREVIKYKREANARIIFDLIDLWPESFPTKILEHTLQKYWKGLRNKYLKYADSVVLQCEYYKQFIKGHIDQDKQTVIYMCRENTESFECCLEEDQNLDELKLVYLGSINSIIDIDAIINLIDNLKKKKKVFLNIIGDGESRIVFEQKLKRAEIHYKYYGKIFDDKELKKILDTCHYGINIYKESTAIGLTMKSLDYFRFGLPVITQNIIDTGILVEKYNSGFHIRKNNFSDIVEGIVNCSFEQWDKMRNQVKIMYKQEFSEIICEKKLSKIIDKIAKG